MSSFCSALSRAKVRMARASFSCLVVGSSTRFPSESRAQVTPQKRARMGTPASTNAMQAAFKQQAKREPASLTTCSTTVIEVRGCRAPRTTASQVFLTSRSRLFSATPGETGSGQALPFHPVVLLCLVQPLEGDFRKGLSASVRVGVHTPRRKRASLQVSE